jgi:uncharacterized iron-regulated membrane protein
MHVRIVGVQDQSVGVARVEMKDARLVMIDPDDGMKVMAIHKTLRNMLLRSLNWSRSLHIAMLL